MRVTGSLHTDDGGIKRDKIGMRPTVRRGTHAQMITDIKPLAEPPLANEEKAGYLIHNQRSLLDDGHKKNNMGQIWLRFADQIMHDGTSDLQNGNAFQYIVQLPKMKYLYHQQMLQLMLDCMVSTGFLAYQVPS